MSNRTELLERLRNELGDTGPVRVWGDSLLESLLDESVDWYSRLFPVHAAAFRDVTAGQTAFSLPPGAIAVTGCECPPGATLPQEAGGPVGAPGHTGFHQSWYVWGGTLYLGNPTSGSEIGPSRLVMSLLIPWGRLDPAEQWNGPPEDERLLVIWAATEAWAWLDGQDQKRGRNSRQGGMAKRYAEQLEREVTARKRTATSRQLESS